MNLSVIKKGMLVMVLLLPLQAIAKGEVYTSFFSNLAIGGFDTVAYFSENKPVKGDSDFSLEYKDVEWQFSSQENLFFSEHGVDPTCRFGSNQRLRLFFCK